jgi:hypothetical protein
VWRTDVILQTDRGNIGISKIKPRVRHLINVKEPHFLHFEA